jgi:hypothetical protein
MDKLEIKQGSFMQQTQYFIPVEIDLSVVRARLGISDFFTCPDFLKFIFILLDIGPALRNFLLDPLNFCRTYIFYVKLF